MDIFRFVVLLCDQQRTPCGPHTPYHYVIWKAVFLSVSVQKLVYTPGKYIVLADVLSREGASSKVTTNCAGNCKRRCTIKSVWLSQRGRPKGSCQELYHCEQTWVWLMALCWDKTESSFHNPCSRTCFTGSMKDILAEKNVKQEPEKQSTGIKIDVWEMIGKCGTFLRHHYKQTKEPILIEWPMEKGDSWSIPSEWQGLSNGNRLLLQLPLPWDSTALQHISTFCHLTHKMFAKLGIPQCVVSDNYFNG